MPFRFPVDPPFRRTLCRFLTSKRGRTRFNDARNSSLSLRDVSFKSFSDEMADLWFLSSCRFDIIAQCSWQLEDSPQLIPGHLSCGSRCELSITSQRMLAAWLLQQVSYNKQLYPNIFCLWSFLYNLNSYRNMAHNHPLPLENFFIAQFPLEILHMLCMV